MPTTVTRTAEMAAGISLKGFRPMAVPDLIFISSEDDRYVVKGGIGTAVGVLSDSIRRLYPDRRVDWVTESPTSDTFRIREGSVTRHYVSRQEQGKVLPLSRFAERLDGYLRGVLAHRLEDPDSGGVVIEAADWEGLAWRVFDDFDKPDVLRVSRIHTPLALCVPVNELDLNPENDRQMEREAHQLRNSDLFSSPTHFVLQETVKTVLSANHGVPASVVIPNCANVAGFMPSENGRRAALSQLRNSTGISVPESAFTIFVLGSVEIRKGVRIIQETIPKLFREIPNAQLVWVGHYAASGEITANSKLDADTFFGGIPNEWHDRVHLAGFIDYKELPHVFPAADLFTICYLSDNFPGVVLEVALAEKPLVTLLRGGVPEMVVDRGRPLALALDDGSPGTVTDQLVSAVKGHFRDPKPARTLATELRKHVLERFSPAYVTPRLLATYDEHLRKKRERT